jgi:hypothetical protein
MAPQHHPERVDEEGPIVLKNLDDRPTGEVRGLSETNQALSGLPDPAEVEGRLGRIPQRVGMVGEKNPASRSRQERAGEALEEPIGLNVSDAVRLGPFLEQSLELFFGLIAH